MRQRVCMCLRIWACAGQGLISGIVFYRSPSYIFRQNHSVEPKAHGLASQLALGFPVFTVLRLQRGYHTLSAFMWVLGSELWSSCLWGKDLTHRHSLFVLVPAVWSGLTLINLISSIKTLFFLRYRGLGLNHIFGGRKWDTLKSIILWVSYSLVKHWPSSFPVSSGNKHSLMRKHSRTQMVQLGDAMEIVCLPGNCTCRVLDYDLFLDNMK